MMKATRSMLAAPLLAALAVAACHYPGQPVSPAHPVFVKFDDFLIATESARAETYLHGPTARVTDAGAFEQMKQHVLFIYRGVKVQHSFLGADGQTVDCVPLDQQPALKRPEMAGKSVERTAPKPVSTPHEQEGKGGPDLRRQTRKSIDLTLKRGVRDDYGNERYCAAGTIPMRRLTLAELTRFKSLNDFFAKGSTRDEFGAGRQRPGQDLPGDGSTHYYARGVQFVDNFGGDSWLNLWSPSASADRMSLSQQWFVGGDGASKQTVEGGWQVYPDKWGGNQAALFIYYTTAGYSAGSGCYNLDCAGFVQIANNVYLGSGFTNYSTTGGGQWGFNLQWKRNTDGNWWLFYRGPGNYIAVGYYPASLWGTGQLATNATKIAYGGEDTGTPSALQLGAGQAASAGWQQAAFQNFVFYIDTSTTSQWASLDSQTPNPDCYTVAINNIFGSWGTYFYFGGPRCN
jgi:hypothetical protein